MFGRHHRLHRLDDLGHVADPVLYWARDFTRHRRWAPRHRRARGMPRLLLGLLLVGIAAFLLSRRRDNTSQWL